MSGKTDVLNRTWTRAPDPDELENNDMVVEDVEMMLEHEPPEFKSSNVTMLVETSTTVNNKTYNQNESKTPPAHALNNQTYNAREGFLSPCKSPYYLIKCLNIDFERVSIEMDNFKTRFESIDDNCDSIFDENAMLLL
jgi:hypothetical protein